ncbi:hypothetical protein [Peribacillus huizhouensis]|uniref:Uncharacterized protein n=1 Tax=Peribacillus huizhouensis TaxID=1501239 RepID=A0ABR6CUK9_9BACI|nr:hypothetical protein [Peribacillus huizhouensis]MBA9028644.1 hypothetical protein [Peribacillus huizhouensis]
MTFNERLDKAVAAAPHDSRFQYLRGSSAYRLPEKYFQRTWTVIEDYIIGNKKEEEKKQEVPRKHHKKKIRH